MQKRKGFIYEELIDLGIALLLIIISIAIIMVVSGKIKDSKVTKIDTIGKYNERALYLVGFLSKRITFHGYNMSLLTGNMLGYEGKTEEGVQFLYAPPTSYNENFGLKHFISTSDDYSNGWVLDDVQKEKYIPALLIKIPSTYLVESIFFPLKIDIDPDLSVGHDIK